MIIINKELKCYKPCVENSHLTSIIIMLALLTKAITAFENTGILKGAT